METGIHLIFEQMRKISVIIALVCLFTTGLSAQILKPIKWDISSKKVSEGV